VAISTFASGRLTIPIDGVTVPEAMAVSWSSRGCGSGSWDGVASSSMAMECMDTSASIGSRMVAVGTDGVMSFTAIIWAVVSQLSLSGCSASEASRTVVTDGVSTSISVTSNLDAVGNTGVTLSVTVGTSTLSPTEWNSWEGLAGSSVSIECTVCAMSITSAGVDWVSMFEEMGFVVVSPTDVDHIPSGDDTTCPISSNSSIFEVESGRPGRADVKKVRTFCLAAGY